MASICIDKKCGKRGRDTDGEIDGIHHKIESFLFYNSFLVPSTLDNLKIFLKLAMHQYLLIKPYLFFRDGSIQADKGSHGFIFLFFDDGNEMIALIDVDYYLDSDEAHDDFVASQFYSYFCDYFMKFLRNFFHNFIIKI